MYKIDAIYQILGIFRQILCFHFTS